MFRIDFRKLAILLLPIPLRKVKTIRFLHALLSPTAQVHSQFSKNRESHLYDLSITPQVCYLEKALNDRFDYVERRIYIQDSVHPSVFYIYRSVEDKPYYMDGVKFIYGHKDYLAEKTDFTVFVPNTLEFDTNEMVALLNKYKLASMKFRIHNE